MYEPHKLQISFAEKLVILGILKPQTECVEDEYKKNVDIAVKIQPTAQELATYDVNVDPED
jgi:hypothetical protein